MNRARTAYSIARTGHAVARGDHLLASNQPKICSSCTGTCNQGRDCESSRLATQRALQRAGRFCASVAAAAAPYLLCVAFAVAWAAVPVYLDQAGPQTARSCR